jgi:hypothetical protein
MHPVKWHYFVLAFLCPVIIFGQTLISGSIAKDSTLKKDKSPYKLSDNLSVDRGAKLTVESGTTIDLNQKWIYLNESTLNANDVTFNGGSIIYCWGSSGNLSGCRINSVVMEINDNSHPVLTANNFNSNSSIHIQTFSMMRLIDLSNNIFQNIKVILFGTYADNAGSITLKCLNNAGYYIEDNLDMKNTSLVIEKNANIYWQGHTLLFRRQGAAAVSFDADGASFYDGNFVFYDSTSGSIKNCKFINTKTTLSGATKLSISSSEFDLNSTLTIYSDLALANLSSDNKFTEGHVYIRPAGVSDISLKKIIGADYYLLGGTRIKGKTISIEKNVKLFFQGYYLSFEGTDRNTNLLTADSASFYDGNIIFHKSAAGILTGSTFTGVIIDTRDSTTISISNSSFIKTSLRTKDKSLPTLNNNKFDSASGFDCNAENGLLNVGNNTFDSKVISIGFSVTKEMTLKKYEGITYQLTSLVEVCDKARLNIESGVKLLGKNVSLICYKGGSISAAGTVFDVHEISLLDFENANIENSTFHNCSLSIEGNYNPSFKSNSFTGSSIIRVNSQNLFDNFESLTGNNVYTRRSIGINGMVDADKKTSIDTLMINYGSNGVKRKIQGNYVLWGGIDVGYFPGSSGEVEIIGCTIINNLNINLHTESKVKFTDCIFKSARIAVYETSSLEISGSDFLIPSVIYVYSPGEINLINNYWGSASGPKFSTTQDGTGFHIYRGRQDANIKYLPFVITPFHSTVGIENDKESKIPNEFYLYQNYPNPFNPATTIKYSLPQSGQVNIKIYNILSQEIATLVNETQPAGVHNVNFNAGNLPSGIYTARLQTNNNVKSIKLLLVK